MLFLIGIILIKDIMKEYIEKLKEACKEHSLRYTTQREKVFLAVAGTKTHPNVKAVFDKVREEICDISIDTVYRNLQTLEELNLIFRVDNQIPMARFDADLNQHAHFLCSECGAVFDIPLTSELKLPLEAKNFGETQRINLQIRGICNECLTERTLK